LLEDGMDKTLIVDIRKCLACKSCEIACAVEHSRSKTLEGALAESPRPQKMVEVEAAGEFAVPIQCRHCEDAPCIPVCPTAAINRRDENGPVIIEQDRCIGCKFCLIVCPFGVIDMSRNGRAAIKCDLCLGRAAEGLEPACVESCPTRALKLSDVKQFAAERRKETALKSYRSH
jgi:carbon-monoxide dehydrogenase iron sulfur subunit